MTIQVKAIEQYFHVFKKMFRLLATAADLSRWKPYIDLIKDMSYIALSRKNKLLCKNLRCTLYIENDLTKEISR